MVKSDSVMSDEDFDSFLNSPSQTKEASSDVMSNDDFDSFLNNSSASPASTDVQAGLEQPAPASEASAPAPGGVTGEVVQMSSKKPGPQAVSTTAGKEGKAGQVAPNLFINGDTLFDSDRRTVKPGQFVTLSRKDGTSQLLSFEGASEDGKPVFKEVKGVATAGADMAGEINISEDDYNRMFDAGNAKVDRPFWEQVRNDALADTGDAYRYTDDARGTFNAFYDYLMPFLGGSAKKEHEERTRILSDIREGRLDGYDGDTDAAKLRDAARKAKLEPWNPLESLHPGESDEDFAQRIRQEAEDELKLGAAAKGRAKQARQQTEATVGDKILKGGVESGAFALQFAIPGSIMFKGLSSMGMGAKAVRALTMLGSAIPATIAEADKRYSENITPEYGWKMKSLDGEPEFGMVAAPDAPGEAAYKAIGGAVFDTAVEVGLEAATMGLLRLAGKPAGWLLGKATPGAVKEWGAKKFNRFMASETGQALRQINRAYQDFAGMTQINSPFGELAEENVQALEKVLNLDGKTSEYKGLQKEWNDFYDRQFNADTQWDIFYGLIAQLGLGAAKSTAEGVARHVSEADVRRDVRMALARSGISEATLKTLTPEQQKKLDDMWRQYSADPDALKENVKDLGISMRLAVDELTAREGLKMRQTLEQRGIAPERFTIQTGADGKPAFQKMTRFTPDGKKAPMNAMTDAAHGVTIVDQGDGNFYVMNDFRGLDAIPASSFEEAQKKADAEVVRNQSMDADNEQKAQYLMGLVQRQYAGRNVVSIPSEAALRWQVAQAVRDGKSLFDITRADQLFREDGSLRQPGAGGFHTPDGHIVVILDNVPSPAEMERVLAHEATGHEGVEGATGRGAKTVEFIQNAQAEGFNRFVEGERQRAIQRRVAEGMDEATATAQVDAAMATDDYKRESMARYAQGRLHAPTWYERRKHKVNERRRAAGEDVPTDQADLEVMLAEQEAQGRAGDNELETLNADSGVRYEEGVTDETGNGAAEAPAQPEQGEERGQEAPRPEAGAEPGAPAPDAGVVEPISAKKMRAMKYENVIALPDSWQKYSELQSRLMRTGDKGGVSAESPAGKQIKSELGRMDADGWGELYKAKMSWAGADRKSRGEQPPDTLEAFKEWKAAKKGETSGNGSSADVVEPKPKAKTKRGDNLRGYSYEDYGAHPDGGGTGDKAGASLLRFVRDQEYLLKMPPDGAADPMADWIRSFLDGNAKKNRRGDYIALFGMKPRTGTNDAIAQNMPDGLKQYVENMIEEEGPGAVADWFLDVRQKYSEWAANKRNAAREEKAVAKERAEEAEALESFDFDELAAARDAMDAEFADALGVVEGADEADYVALAPASLQVAKSGDTIRFDHDRKSFVFGSFDAGSGVLVVYDEDVAGMEGGKFRRAYRVTENSIEEIDDGQGNEVRADADRAGDEKGPAGGGGEAQGGGFRLESVTAEQITAEEKKRREEAEIKKRQEAPLKGSGAVNVQPEMDLGQTGQQDLFSPIVKNEETPTAAKEKAAERPAEYLAWLEKYKMNDTDRHFAEWQRKQAARKPVKATPAAAQKRIAATTPPKATKLPKGETPKADETMAAKNIDVSAFVKAQREAEADDAYEGDRGLADLIESLPPEKAQKLVGLWNESNRLDDEADKLVDEHSRLNRFNQTKFDSDENERKHADLRARARALQNEAHNMLLREAEANGWEQGEDAETGGGRWVKRPAQKPAKTAPVSAPRAKGTTTPPKSADAPQVVKTTRDGESIRIVENGREYEVELPDVKFPKTFTKATSKADWEAKMAEVKKIADELKKKAPFHSVINPKTGKYYANGSEVARQRRREVAAYEEAVRWATNQAFDEIGEYDDSWDEEPTNAAPKKTGATTPPKPAKPVEGRKSASEVTSAVRVKDGVANAKRFKTGDKVSFIEELATMSSRNTASRIDAEIFAPSTEEVPDKVVVSDGEQKWMVDADLLKTPEEMDAFLSNRRKAIEKEAAESAKTAPTSAPSAKGTTTPPKSADAPQGGKSASGNVESKTFAQALITGATNLNYAYEHRENKAAFDYHHGQLADAMAKASDHDLRIAVKVAETERGPQYHRTKKTYDGKPLLRSKYQAWEDIRKAAEAELAKRSAPVRGNRTTERPIRAIEEPERTEQKFREANDMAQNLLDVLHRGRQEQLNLSRERYDGMKAAIADAKPVKIKGVENGTAGIVKVGDRWRVVDLQSGFYFGDGASKADAMAESERRIGIAKERGDLERIIQEGRDAFAAARSKYDADTSKSDVAVPTARERLASVYAEWADGEALPAWADRLTDAEAKEYADLIDAALNVEGDDGGKAYRAVTDFEKRHEAASPLQTRETSSASAQDETQAITPPKAAKPAEGGKSAAGGTSKSSVPTASRTPATPAFKRGDRVFLKGAADGQRVTFLKANADGTADVRVRTPGANRYAPEKVETRTVPMGDVSSTGMKDTLTGEERNAYRRGVAEQTRGAMRNDPALRRIDAAYRAAKTDAERTVLKAQFAERVRALQGDVNFDTPGIYTGTAADYANRSRQGGKDDGPSLKKIGTGEGSQVYGWGLYGSNVRGVADRYAKNGRGAGGKDWIKEGRNHDELSDVEKEAASYLKGMGSKEGAIERLKEDIEWFEKQGIKEEAEALKPIVEELSAHGDEYREQHENVYEQTFFTDRAPGDESHLLKWYEPVSEEQMKWIRSHFNENQEELILDWMRSYYQGREGSGPFALDRSAAEQKARREWEEALAFNNRSDEAATGKDVYTNLSEILGPQAASEFLARAGIDGIKYPVDSYGGKGVKDGDKVGWNYVSFRDDNIRVDHKWTDGVLQFDTPELTPAEVEYAASEDKTPTEKVMREVYGMTNDEIATALRAAGMEPPPHVRKTDADMWRQVETLLSNSTYMAKLSRAVAKFPRPTRDYENVALNVLFRQRQAAVNDLERRRAELAAIPEDDMNKTPELRDELKQVSAKLAQAKAQMAEAGKAAMMGASEQGRALRSNRALIAAHDYSYAGIAGRIAQTLGGIDKITPEMNARIRELAKLFEGLDEEGLRLATERLIPLSKKVIDQTKNGLKIRKATERKVGDVARKVAQNYQDALMQIEVGAVETGGTLIGLSDQQYPSWGKWLRQIGEYHCFLNPEITEEEVIDAIVRDISPFMEGVDANQVRDALTGFGHNYKQSRYDAQRLMNSLRNISRSKRQIDWMDETNTMPPATGPIRDEPTQDEREWAKRVRDRKAEVPDAGRDERRLKGILDSAKKRVQNRIADLERAIATGERIPAAQRKVMEDIELRELKKRKDELQKAYDELFGTERTMTDAQRIAATEKALARMLEQTMEDFARAQAGDFSKRPQRPGVTSETIETLRDRIRQVRESIRELKNAKYAFGMTPEEVEALNARKMASREKAVARLAERVAMGDIRPQKRPQPPMTKDQQKRYDELGEQMKRGRQKLAELRLEAENATVPTFVRKGVNFLRFVTTAQRALRATMDFSAVLRQAARMTLGHPVKAAQAFGKAWTAARSEASLLDVNTEIMSDPTVQEAVKKFGLHLREVDAQSDRDVEMFYGIERNKVKIFGKEYAITDIPLFGEFMLKSERHYLTYLNAMSADLYTSIVNGIPGGATPWQKKMVADMINIWNGSAALSKERRQALQKAWVNDIFWAPQLAISRVQSAVGYDWWHPLVAKGIKNADGTFEKVSNDERKTAAKIGLREHLRSTVAMLAIGSLLKWLFSDDDDKYDFSQADWFEKMMMLVSPKIGNTTIDLTGGESTFNRLVHQLATKSKRSGTGRLMKFGDFNGPTTMGTIGRYLQGKLSPSASTIVALWEGKDYVGEEYGVGKMVREMLVPLTFEDVKDQIVQNGVGKSLVTVPLSILGAGGSTYDRKPYENAVNRFLEAKKEYDAIQSDDSIFGDERNQRLSVIREDNPLMRDDVRGKISAQIKGLRTMESTQKKAQKAGRPTDELDARIERRKAEILDMIRASRK